MATVLPPIRRASVAGSLIPCSSASTSCAGRKPQDLPHPSLEYGRDDARLERIGPTFELEGEPVLDLGPGRPSLWLRPQIERWHARQVALGKTRPRPTERFSKQFPWRRLATPGGPTRPPHPPQTKANPPKPSVGLEPTTPSLPRVWGIAPGCRLPSAESLSAPRRGGAAGPIVAERE